MGNAAASGPLSVEDVLGAIPDRPKDTNGGDVDAAREFLALNGIAVVDADASALLTCAAVLRTTGVWSQHYKLHPHQGRVKNWLWVHQKYRDQARALVDMATEQSGGVETVLSNVTAAFEKLEGKIRSHSEFEDDQLFSFFEREIPSAAESMKLLKADHVATNDTDSVKTALQEVPSDIVKIRAALEQYEKNLLDHLSREEDALLGLWLGLTDQQYQQLRSGMNWKYRVMYG